MFTKMPRCYVIVLDKNTVRYQTPFKFVIPYTGSKILIPPNTSYFILYTQDELAAKDGQLDGVQRTKEYLMFEISDLKSKNDYLSGEILRLIEVDRELAKAKETIKHAEDELATKEFMVGCITAVVATYVPSC